MDSTQISEIQEELETHGQNTGTNEDEIESRSAVKDLHIKWITLLINNIEKSLMVREEDQESNKMNRKLKKKQVDCKIEHHEDIANFQNHIQKLRNILLQMEKGLIDFSKLDDLRSRFDDKIISENLDSTKFLPDIIIYAHAGVDFCGENDHCEKVLSSSNEKLALNAGEDEHEINLCKKDSMTSNSTALETNDFFPTEESRKKPNDVQSLCDITSEQNDAVQCEEYISCGRTHFVPQSSVLELKLTPDSVAEEPVLQQAVQLRAAHNVNGLDLNKKKDDHEQNSIIQNQIEKFEFIELCKKSDFFCSTSPNNGAHKIMPALSVAFIDSIHSTIDFEVNEILIDAKEKLPTLAQRRYFRYHQIRTLWLNMPNCFPMQPLKNYATQEFFSKLDLDTLFFAFYCQQGTYQQYLAARELKRKLWCYHKKYLTWFQLQHDLKSSNEKNFGGSFIYFDSELGKCARVKNDFVFEMCYCENELPAPSNVGKLQKLFTKHVFACLNFSNENFKLRKATRNMRQ